MRDLQTTYVIARREFLERVQSKWFAAMTLLGPVFIIALVVVPAVLAGRGATGARVDIVDQTAKLAQPLAEQLTKAEWAPNIVAPDTPDAAEMKRIRDHAINGFVTIPANALDGGIVLYRGDNAASEGANRELRDAIAKVVRIQRGKDAGIDAQRLEAVLADAKFFALHTDGKTEGASGMASFVIAYMLAFILYMVITLYGVSVMRSVVQEKTSRVMELMVATIKPRSLMAGKILGVGAAGLVQISVWLVIGAITLAYRDQILGAFGVTGGGAALPPIGLADLSIIIIYFILGFFFYASMYAAVGAMVSSEQDTQQVQMPVTMFLVIGVLCIQLVSNEPHGTATIVMTMAPFWSALLMPMRYVLGGATVGEVALSLAILVGSTVLVARAAAKIYRVGVLMYGKRPGLAELVRWLRY